MLFHVLHLVFTASLVLPHRLIVPCSIISPYVMSILFIIAQCVLPSPCACCEIALRINVSVLCFSK